MKRLCWLLLASSVFAIVPSARAYRTLEDRAELSGRGPVRWRTAALSYELAETPPRGLAWESWRDAVWRGTEAWEAPCSALSIDHRTALTPRAVTEDGRSTVEALQSAWLERGLSADVAATTELVFALDDDGHWEIVEADILLNDVNFTWSDAPDAPEPARSVSTVVTHEWGHFLGILHPCEITADTSAPLCDSAHEGAIMHPLYLGAGRLPAADDLGALCELYPTSARCQSCSGTELCDASGACVPSCTIEGCPDGQLCDGSTCVSECSDGSCGAELGHPCDRGVSCASGSCHARGFCTQTCTTDADCPADWSCSDDGLCDHQGATYGDACLYSTDCVTGHCVGETGGADAFCSLACASAAECPGSAPCREGPDGTFCDVGSAPPSSCRASPLGSSPPFVSLFVLGTVTLALRRRSRTCAR